MFGTALGLGAGMALGAAVPAVASAIPTRSERQYKKHLKEQAESLKKSRGGLKAGERQHLEAEGQQRLQAQMQQAQADISRIKDPVARQRAMSKLQKGAMGQRAAISSDVREQDLKLYGEKLRQLQEGQYRAATLAEGRKRAGIHAALKGAALYKGVGSKVGKTEAETEEDTFGKVVDEPEKTELE